MGEALLASLFIGLASWRIASLLHTEDAFEWLRRWLGIWPDEDGYPAIYPDNIWGKVFDCFWCLSTLVALPVTVLVVVLSGEHIWKAPLIWMAASTVAAWGEKWSMKSHSR